MADDVLKAVLTVKALPQSTDLLHQMRVVEGTFDPQQQILVIYWFSQIIVGAALDGLNRVLDCSERSDHDHRNFRVVGPDSL